MKKTSKAEKWKNRKIKKKQQNIHFWLNPFCKKTAFWKKNCFSKTTFFNKKTIKLKILQEKTSKTEKCKNRKMKKQQNLHFWLKTLCKKTTFLKKKILGKQHFLIKTIKLKFLQKNFQN